MITRSATPHNPKQTKLPGGEGIVAVVAQVKKALKSLPAKTTLERLVALGCTLKFQMPGKPLKILKRLGIQYLSPYKNSQLV
jgi:hypothetical protein